MDIINLLEKHAQEIGLFFGYKRFVRVTTFIKLPKTTIKELVYIKGSEEMVVAFTFTGTQLVSVLCKSEDEDIDYSYEEKMVVIFLLNKVLEECTCDK